MIRFITLIILLFWSNMLTLGQYKLQGTIKDEEGKPLQFSNVLLLTNDEKFVKGEVADVYGHFTFTDILSGKYVVAISAVGYADFRQAVEVNTNVDIGILRVLQNSITLEEVTLTAQKAAFIRKADRTIVNVGSLPTAAGGNALDLLEKSPSVRLDRVNGEISLLGRSGVLVYINGKRTRLEGDDLFQYLTSIPTANIMSLELINNPPASYDADGTGGVINVVLKNYEANGFNGSVNVFSGYGMRGKYGGGGVFNYKSGNINLYGDASTSQDYTSQNVDIISSIQFDDGLLASDQFSNRPAYLANYNGKLGFTYAITPNTSIDVFGAFARRRWEMLAETTTEYDGDISPFQHDVFSGDETNTTNQYNVSTHLEHSLLNGHKISADFDYLNVNVVNPTSYQVSNFDNNNALVNTQTFETLKETPFDFYVGRLDYKGRLSNQLNIEAGLKATFSQVENDVSLVDENGLASSDPFFTDEMDLDEQIYASYFSVDGSLGEKYTFIGGVRYEYSHLELLSAQGDVKREISRLFPTLSFTRNFSEVSRLTIAYRERIARLGFRNLASAFFFLNPYTVLSGNIQALPNINRTGELTLNHRTLFMSVSYSHDDNIVRYGIPRLNQADNLLLLIANNIESRHQVSFNIGFPIKITKFWNSSYNIGSYWQRDEIQIEGITFIERNPFLSIDISQSFQFPKDWSIELSGRWNSRTYQGTLYQPPQTFINFGVQKKFKKGTIGLSWTDIFDSGSFLGFVNELPEQGIVYDWNYDLEGSIIRLSYSYSFGGKVKTARSSGASDVLERVNN